jgi:hypothetical protein
MQVREPECPVEFADTMRKARRDAVFLGSLAGHEAAAAAEHDGRAEPVLLGPQQPLAAVVVDDLDVVDPKAAGLAVGDIPAGTLAPGHDTKVARGILLGETSAV